MPFKHFQVMPRCLANKHTLFLEIADLCLLSTECTNSVMEIVSALFEWLMMFQQDLTIIFRRRRTKTRWQVVKQNERPVRDGVVNSLRQPTITDEQQSIMAMLYNSCNTCNRLIFEIV